MKLKELIRELQEYNQEAEVDVVAHCRSYPFTLASGGSDGSDESNCESVSFYVDELCTNETQNIDES
jgi:hypothetical protein